MKIDIFPHILPPKYLDSLHKKGKLAPFMQKAIEAIPTLRDLDNRFRIMDKYNELVQVLTLAGPALETIAPPEEAVELAKIANDEMAELVTKYPDRFVAAVASLPLNNIDAALKEVDRAIKELNFRGIQISTPINDKSLDSPEFMPLYEKMSRYDLPIWLHPERGASVPDYKSEDSSKFSIHLVFGWPYETTTAMTRLVFSGVLEKYPTLKFITHHCGAMVPYFEHRIVSSYDLSETRLKTRFEEGLTKRPIDYFRMFYADTAVSGSQAALMCGYAFFGPDHILFGTDMPYDNQLGERHVRETICSVEEMDIPELDKKKIFEDNARKLLRLPV